jgi:hypothetical protein
MYCAFEVSADLAKIISSLICSVNENRSTKTDSGRLVFEPIWHKSSLFCENQQKKVFDFFCIDWACNCLAEICFRTYLSAVLAIFGLKKAQK